MPGVIDTSEAQLLGAVSDAIMKGGMYKAAGSAAALYAFDRFFLGQPAPLLAYGAAAIGRYVGVVYMGDSENTLRKRLTGYSSFLVPGAVLATAAYMLVSGRQAGASLDTLKEAAIVYAVVYAGGYAAMMAV